MTSKLNPGTVIYVMRSFPIIYKHFGVYVGDDKVVHFAPNRSGKYYTQMSDDETIIHEIDINDFIGNSERCFTQNFPQNQKELELILKVKHKSKSFIAKIMADFDRSGYQFFSQEEVVNRARNEIGRKGYNVLWNNCEHFAVWCKTNVVYSNQVEHLYNLLLF